MGACIFTGDFALTKSKFNLLPLGREPGGMRGRERERESSFNRALDPLHFLTKAALCFPVCKITFHQKNSEAKRNVNPMFQASFGKRKGIFRSRSSAQLLSKSFYCRHLSPSLKGDDCWH